MDKPKEVSKKVKLKDGTVMYIWNNKLHSWEGPSLIPPGSAKLAEYYVYGIKYTKEKWLEAKKDFFGLPYHKTAAGKQTGERF